MFQEITHLTQSSESEKKKLSINIEEKIHEMINRKFVSSNLTQWTKKVSLRSKFITHLDLVYQAIKEEANELDGKGREIAPRTFLEKGITKNL